MIPVLDLKAQYRQIKDEIDAAIAQVLSSGEFVLGEQVKAFEAEFASYCQTQYAVAVNSGTSALHLALLATGVRPGDEVITVSFTFVATVAAILYVRATPVFVDIDPRTYTLDSSQLEQAITPRTKALMPVHLYGNCADMDAINEIAGRHGLLVIEDAAQAHGAESRGQRAGSLSDIACFSFYPTKNLGAFGEAGAVVTDSEEYATRMRVLRDQGQSQKYYHDTLGYNYRMEAMQAAVLRVKLRHLDGWNKSRRRLAQEYRRRLADANVSLLAETAASKCVYHQFPIFTPERDALRKHLQMANVATGIHYPVPLHLQRAYISLGYKSGDFPETERAAEETLSLPMYPELAIEKLSYVADAVCQFRTQQVAVH